MQIRRRISVARSYRGQSRLSRSQRLGIVGQLAAILPTPPSRNPVLFNDRGLRAGWRLLIYFLLVAISFTLIGFAARKLGAPTRGVPPPSAVLIQELIGFAVVFGCALIMSKIERRSPGDYGLPIAEAFGRKFWLGMLFGVVEISLLIGLISAFGGYSFGSIALSTKGIFGWGLFHLCCSLSSDFSKSSCSAATPNSP